MADFLSTNSGGTFGQFQALPPGMSSMEFFLRSTPGWQFAQSQANRALQGSAAMRGTLGKQPGTLRALANYYVPGVADQTYGAQVGRYLSLADLGLRGAIAPFA